MSCYFFFLSSWDSYGGWFVDSFGLAPYGINMNAYGIFIKNVNFKYMHDLTGVWTSWTKSKKKQIYGLWHLIRDFSF